MSKTKLINGHEYVEYDRETLSEDELMSRSESFYQWMDKRRSVRQFSDRPIPVQVIQNLISTASTAPSGAHKQPWTFCVVSDPKLKGKIRKAAEEEEYENYHHRMGESWLKDLQPLGTNWHKPFLEIAPFLIVVFRKTYGLQDGKKNINYYVNESVGLSCGFLLAAIHHAGLVALTHTPSPMNFLTKILKRPENERPYLLIPLGYPASETFVPKLTRKPLDQVAVFY